MRRTSAGSAGSTSRVLIYTAICGAYDDLNQPAVQNIPCDFVCFTDTPAPSRSDVWRVIQFNADPKVHPRMRAKFFKICSHKVIPRGRLAFKYDPLQWLTPFKGRYDFTIWIDGSLSIRSRTFARDMISAIRDAGWAMFAHPDRDCIFEEAIVSAQMEKYRNLAIHEQVMFYKGIGVQPHSGLFACGVIVRKEPLPRSLIDANLTWWEENCNRTYQDQLSLPYVSKVHNLEVDKIPGNLWQNCWFDYIAHKSAS